MSQSGSKIIESRYIWAPTIQEAMDTAHSLRLRGWRVQGNPAPMFFLNKYGTGVTIMRVVND